MKYPFFCKTALVLCTAIPSLAYSDTYTVDTVAELKTRLENAQNGDVINIDGNGGNKGVYTYTGSTYSKYTTDGWTNTSPVFLISDAANVTIQALNASKKPTLKGQGSNDKYIFYGQEVSGLTIKNIKFTQGRKGVVIDRSDNITFDNNEIYEIGEEAFHLRDGSDHATISNNKIHDTGLIKVNRGEAIYICNDRKMWHNKYQPKPVEENYLQNCDYAHIYGNTIGPNIGNNGVDIKEGTVGAYIENNTFNMAWTRNELKKSSAGDHPNVVIHLKGTQGVATGNTFNFENAPTSLYRAVSVDAQLDKDNGLALIHGYDNWAVKNKLTNARKGNYVFHALSDGGATYGCNTGATDSATRAKSDRIYRAVTGSDCNAPKSLIKDKPTAKPTPTAKPKAKPTVKPKAKPTVKPKATAKPKGPRGYQYAAKANGVVKFSGTVNIAYGAGKSFKYLKNQKKSVKCSNSAFGGDPIRGTVKACFIKQPRKRR